MEEPVVVQKAPYVMKTEPRKYAWCACGLSQGQPFCDGAHKGTGFSPIIEEITVERNVAWCGCKLSKTKPFCDGSHAEL